MKKVPTDQKAYPLNGRSGFHLLYSKVLQGSSMKRNSSVRWCGKEGRTLVRRQTSNQGITVPEDSTHPCWPHDVLACWTQPLCRKQGKRGTKAPLRSMIKGSPENSRALQTSFMATAWLCFLLQQRLLEYEWVVQHWGCLQVHVKIWFPSPRIQLMQKEIRIVF